MSNLDYDSRFDEINEIWPVKRLAQARAAERTKFIELVKTQEDFEKLKNRVEIEVTDKSLRKLPPLLDLIEETFRVTSRQIVSTPTFVPVIKTVSVPSETDVVFEEVYSAWPENEIKQNKQKAQLAFNDAVRKYGLDDVRSACNCYIQEQKDPTKATVNPLGIKRFVSTDDIIERWVDKASQPPPEPVDTAWFDAAWSWYPEFAGKDKAREDSLSFYMRFIQTDDVVDFWCAIRAYAFSRKEDARAKEAEGTYSPEDEVKFTKSFINFVRCWKEQKYADYLIDLIMGPMVAGFKKRNIPYWCVYPEEMHLSAVTYNCKQYKGAIWAINKHVENVCNYLTTGKNYANITVNTPVDYGLISEVIGSVKEAVKKVKCSSNLNPQVS